MPEPDFDLGVQSTQPMYRRDYVAKDQWGRPWLVTVETKTGDLVGIASPTDWTDPIPTPAEYINISRRDPNLIVIDFDAWIRHLEVKHNDWQQRLEDEGSRILETGGNFDPESPSVFVMRRVGPKPMDVEIVKRARDGDPKLLGRAPVPTPADERAALENELRVLRAEREEQLEQVRAAEAERDLAMAAATEPDKKKKG